MPPTLFLLFNHDLTPSQEAGAWSELQVGAIVKLPLELYNLWSQIPADLRSVSSYIGPIKRWLAAQAREGDYVLIQGDFGAVYLMVQFCLERGLIPVYSTTRRQADENHLPDGSVQMTHHFQHHIFRRYGM